MKTPAMQAFFLALAHGIPGTSHVIPANFTRHPREPNVIPAKAGIHTDAPNSVNLKLGIRS